ncbi:MAG TPA: DNA gyrase inhibitor YacG [Cycloclasticus sp.]|nr:DNA gyrase inhibitor YacG [Cycloclasticus sp.]
MTTSVSCPSCEKKVLWNQESPFKPFCCERCKMIDLGDWASEKHAISGEPAYLNEELENLESEFF